MEELLDELIEAIYKEESYIRFKECAEKLSQEDEILSEYRRVLDEYQEMKQYETYIDFSSTKEKLKAVQQKMNASKIIQDYYASYHELNSVLSTITDLIFKDLSTELSTSMYSIGR